MIRRKAPLTPAEALGRAAALCDKCEQCTTELYRKFETWGLSSADARRVMGRLIELRYVDDRRYCRAYAHSKMAYSGWGRYKILMGLRAKRLDRDDIDYGLGELDPDEYRSVALRVVRSKVRQMDGGLSTYENRMKVLRFGAGRGFEPALLTAIINRLAKAETDEDDPSGTSTD